MNTFRSFSFAALAAFVLAAAMMTGCASESAQSSGGYHVQGTIAGLESGTVYLIKETLSGGEDIDTVAVGTGGTFEFRGKIDQPGMHGLRINRERNTIPLFLENSDITINGDMTQLQAAQVNGSESHTSLMTYIEKLRAFDVRDRELQQEYGRILQTSGGDTTGVGKQIQSIIDELNGNVVAKMGLQNNFAIENAGSPAGAYAAWMNFRNRFYDSPGANFDATLAALEADAPESQYTQWIKQSIAGVENTKVGAVAPDFAMPDADGKSVSLSDFRGRYVLVDFWAGWCGPCRRENPNLVRAYDTYGGEEFEILGVSLDNQKPYWQAAVEADGLTWPQISDLKKWNSPVVGMYAIKGIPANFLLDPEGVIIAKNLRGPALEAKLAELFPGKEGSNG